MQYLKPWKEYKKNYPLLIADLNSIYDKNEVLDKNSVAMIIDNLCKTKYGNYYFIIELLLQKNMLDSVMVDKIVNAYYKNRFYGFLNLNFGQLLTDKSIYLLFVLGKFDEIENIKSDIVMTEKDFNYIVYFTCAYNRIDLLLHPKIYYMMTHNNIFNIFK